MPDTIAQATETPDPKKVRTAYFTQYSNLSEAEVNAADYTVKGVTLIKPGFSTNTDKAGRPRYYGKTVLEQAAKVFEGTRAYANHPSKSQQTDLPERDIRDIVGYYENVKPDSEGALRGDLRVVGEARNWLWPMIEETVTRKPDLVQTSINAMGQTSLGEAEGRKAVVVESIMAANSVDVVTTGAAGGSFAGALLASDGDNLTANLLAAMTFEEWREARAEFVDKLKNEWKTTRDTEALKEAKAEKDKLQEEITRLTETNRANETELANLRRGVVADRLLEASALPKQLRPVIREQLLKETDEAAMAKVLEAEKAKFKVTPKPPVEIQKPAPAALAPAPAKPANPAARLLGLSESAMALPNETAEEYRARRLRQGA